MPRRVGPPGPHAWRVCGGRGGAERRCLDPVRLNSAVDRSQSHAIGRDLRALRRPAPGSPAVEQTVVTNHLKIATIAAIIEIRPAVNATIAAIILKILTRFADSNGTGGFAITMD